MPNVDAGGTDLHYVRAGKGEPMLLIQGMSATHLAWGRPFLDELEPHFECIVFDNRGMGRSGHAELPFAVADLAGDALALLDALEIESAHVVGISMGGMIAQEMALAAPRRIRTLTIGASFCGGPEGRLMDPADVKMLVEAMEAGDRMRVYRAMWEINLSPAFRADDSRFEPFQEMAEALPASGAVIRQQMLACGAHDASSRLAPLDFPVQVVHGTADRLLPVANGHQIARLLGVEPTLLEDVGHMFWWEAPQRSAALVREHALEPA